LCKMMFNVAVQVLLLASAVKAQSVSVIHANLGLFRDGQENLVKNGSFEETKVAPNTWANFDPKDVPGWVSKNGERIELWGAGFNKVPAPHGQNILEIDYNSAAIDHIYQDIQTVKGQKYEASFFLRARSDNNKSEDETAVFSWNGAESSFTAEKKGEWTRVSVIVDGTGGMDRLALRESMVTGANNSLGPLIDDVRLVTIDSNLLVNGSFEMNKVEAGKWTHFPCDQVPGWLSKNGEQIELWGTGMNGVPAVDGVNFLEIDYQHAGAQIDFIFQDVQTKKGQTYEASFFIRARSTNFDSEDETAVFSWNGDESSFRAEKAGVWTKISVIVVGSGGLDRFALRESMAPGASNSLGPLIDNCRLEAVDPNLLVNGSFEATKVAVGSWAHFDQTQILGWKSLNGERIELWGTPFIGVTAQDGVNLMELDYSNGKLDYIYQDVKTKKGQTYEACFYIRARSATHNSPDETAVFSWNGVETAYTAEKAAVWTKITTIVYGTGGSDRFGIRESSELGANNGLGPLIDNVSLKMVDTNLIVNGSFEATKVAVNSWGQFSPNQIPGWKSLNGEQIELWGTPFIGVTAQDGTNLMELDNNAGKLADHIFQDVQTIKDQMYKATFYIRARGSKPDSPDETAVFSWCGAETPFTATKVGEWREITIMVKGTGGVDRFAIRESSESGANNGLGPLIDNVSLVPVASANTPSDTRSGDKPLPLPVRYNWNASAIEAHPLHIAYLRQHDCQRFFRRNPSCRQYLGELCP
jgi:Protein of unknown function (DUF642)